MFLLAKDGLQCIGSSYEDDPIHCRPSFAKTNMTYARHTHDHTIRVRDGVRVRVSVRVSVTIRVSLEVGASVFVV